MPENDFTFDMLEKYLDHEGRYCPFCGSVNIIPSPFDGTAWTQDIRCDACHETWIDCYTMTGVIHNGNQHTRD